jgi:hypothetical protein
VQRRRREGGGFRIMEERPRRRPDSES